MAAGIVEPVVLICGATGLWGRALGVSLQAAGAHVVGGGVDQVALMGLPVELPLTLDPADPVQVSTAIAVLEDRFGRLDLLLLADRPPAPLLADLAAAVADRLGPLPLVEAARPLLLSSGGRLGLLVGPGGLRAVPGAVTACAVEQALVGAARSWEADGLPVHLIEVPERPDDAAVKGVLAALQPPTTPRRRDRLRATLRGLFGREAGS